MGQKEALLGLAQRQLQYRELLVSLSFPAFTGSPSPGDGARGAPPMSWCSRQHICEGVGDALGPQEIRTCCTERASLVWIGTDARKGSGQEAGSIATQSRE